MDATHGSPLPSSCLYSKALRLISEFILIGTLDIYNKTGEVLIDQESPLQRGSINEKDAHISNKFDEINNIPKNQDASPTFAQETTLTTPNHISNENASNSTNNLLFYGTHTIKVKYINDSLRKHLQIPPSSPSSPSQGKLYDVRKGDDGLFYGKVALENSSDGCIFFLSWGGG